MDGLNRIGVARTWQAAALWRKFSAVGRSPAAVRGVGLLALAGLYAAA